MTSDLIYGALVVSGLIVLVIAVLLLLARWMEKAAKAASEPACEPRGDAQSVDSHRLSVSIAEALLDHQFIEPTRFNEVAQIVALKIELQKALGAP